MSTSTMIIIILLGVLIVLEINIILRKSVKPIIVEYYSHEDKCYYSYVINPRLLNPDDLFFDGAGPNWDTDLDGRRYRKIYDPKKLTFHHDVLEGKLEPGCTVPGNYTDLPFLN